MQHSLFSLTTKLINHIISYVQQPSHLLNLALVSQDLYKLTKSHLYRDVHVTHYNDVNHTGHLLSFTILILQKPEIASLVRSFALSFKNERPH